MSGAERRKAFSVGSAAASAPKLTERNESPRRERARQERPGSRRRRIAYSRDRLRGGKLDRDESRSAATGVALTSRRRANRSVASVRDWASFIFVRRRARNFGAIAQRGRIELIRSPLPNRDYERVTRSDPVARPPSRRSRSARDFFRETLYSPPKNISFALTCDASSAIYDWSYTILTDQIRSCMGVGCGFRRLKTRGKI